MDVSADLIGTEKHRGWPSVYAIGLSTFAVVTTEMLPVGLMKPIADTLDVTIGTAGLMISIPAILAAFFAPFVIFVAGRIDRRLILAALLLLLVAANIASAIAPLIGWLLVARVVVGFCMGGIWAIAGGLASRLVPAQSTASATAIIFGGVAAASVLGVPLGAMIGDLAGWRWAFSMMAGFSTFVLGLTLWAVPALPVNQAVGFRQFSEQLARPPVRLGLVLTLLIVAGHFMAYTFVNPLLLGIPGIAEEWVGGLLFVYGAAGIVGNFLAGRLVAQRTKFTLAMIAVAVIVAILGFVAPGETAVRGAILLVLWGVAYGGVSVSLQTWMMKAAPSAIVGDTDLTYEIFELGDIQLQSRRRIRDAKLAYKTYGTLNAAKNNAIIYPTSFAATHEDAAWLIGEGRVLDPDNYLIIIPNMFGNGLSSSPSNTPTPAGASRFPDVTIHDNVAQQHRLLTEKFGIERLHLAIGWSLGGAQAFEWAAAYPDMVERLFTFQSAARTSRHFHLFFDSVRAAIELDAEFRDGFYTRQPHQGLRVAARIYAAWGFSQGFFREHLDEQALGYTSLEDFLVDFWEGWFLRRDANDILAHLWTGQSADVSNNDRYRRDLDKALAAIKADTIVMPSSSDLYFPVENAAQEARRIPKAELRVLQSLWGHVAGEGMNDADTAFIEQAIRDLLRR